MFTLTQFPLPFEYDALEPHMSENTLHFHHDKHLATYINNLNDLIDGTEYEAMPLRKIIKKAAAENATKIFNNSAQVFNHDFFFHCLRRGGGGRMPDEIADAFGGAGAFCAEFKSTAAAIFGSGWAWVARDGDTLKIIAGKNADTPIAHGMQPILALDVWEHAYYLKYKNLRVNYIKNIWNLLDWSKVEENYIKDLAEEINRPELKEILIKLGHSIFNDNHKEK